MQHAALHVHYVHTMEASCLLALRAKGQYRRMGTEAAGATGCGHRALGTVWGILGLPRRIKTGNM